MLRAAAAAGTPYEVAVLDLMMPGMDGIELARQISADPALRSVRLIMLASGLTRRRDAEAAGIGAYLTKPARQSLLYDAARERRRGGVEQARPADAGAGSVRGAADVEAPRILVVEDNPVNQAVAEAMLDAPRAFRGDRAERSRGPRRPGGRRLRRRADGLPDARDGRLRGDGRDPPPRGRRSATRRSSR